MGIPQGNTWKMAENRTLKWGSSPPSTAGNVPNFERFPYRHETGSTPLVSKWLVIKNL
jgi:hypothetical protein